MAVWGRARYLSVTEAPHNTEFHTWMGKKHFCFFQTTETGNRTPNSSVKGSGANHYPRAPAQGELYSLQITYRHRGSKGTYLTLYKVADTTFWYQGDENDQHVDPLRTNRD